MRSIYQDSKAGALCEFSEAKRGKANIARRCRGSFSSEKLPVTESCIAHIMIANFEKYLADFTKTADTYLTFSPSQIERGDHLKNDPTLGERSWRIPETTGRFLYEIIQNLNLKTGLELGTSTGYSTLWISSALYENNPDFTLTTIERNTSKFETATALFKEILFTKNIAFLNATILEVLKNLQNTIDFIFMDADRGSYAEYWPYIKNLMNKKSIVAIDNAFMEKQSMRSFLNTLSQDETLSTQLCALDNGVFLVSLKDGDHKNISKILPEIVQ